MFERKLERKIQLQKEKKLFRKPKIITQREGKFIFIDKKKYLNFGSNDYLGLATKKNDFAEILKEKNVSASSSRLVSGNIESVLEVERKFADFFGYDDCLFFPSGFQANFALISSLFDSEDNVFYDKHVHASIVSGMKNSKANFIGFNHNSFSHFEKRRKKIENLILISESLFSMDGDFLNEKFLNNKNFFRIIDEAHSVGVFGEKGEGLYNSTQADIKIGTFGKAFGFQGAFLLLPKKIKEYLLNFSPSVVYTTNISPLIAEIYLKQLEKIKNANSERKKLKELIDFTIQEFSENGIEFHGQSQIFGIKIGNEDKATRISEKLFQNGIFVPAIRYPTVPLNKAILRVSLNSLLEKEDIKKFVKILNSIDI